MWKKAGKFSCYLALLQALLPVPLGKTQNGTPSSFCVSQVARPNSLLVAVDHVHLRLANRVWGHRHNQSSNKLHMYRSTKDFNHLDRLSLLGVTVGIAGHSIFRAGLVMTGP